ncbi:MAG TPA: EAL domain-containing protein, partial [Polyangiales bacterium]
MTGVQRIANEMRARDLPSVPVPPAADVAAASLDEALDALLARKQAPDLVFQPIVDLQRGLCAGYEVLARFQGPPRATPDAWFIAAHARGRGVELEALVIERALSQRRWLPRDCFLTINVAPAALLSESIQTLLRSQLLSHVVFELTEHVPVADYDLLVRAIREVKRLGALVAVDDAGAGYASLKHILLLRPDFVKLDRALVAGVHTDEAKAALVEMFGGFTSRIDAWLCAEGVEGAAELSRLIQLGVPLAQGYFLGRPEPTMRLLKPSLATRLTSMAPELERSTLVRLLEPGSTASASMEDAALRALLFDLGVDVIALLDPLERPQALARRVGHTSVERRPVMAVIASMSAVD